MFGERLASEAEGERESASVLILEPANCPTAGPVLFLLGRLYCVESVPPR